MENLIQYLSGQTFVEVEGNDKKVTSIVPGVALVKENEEVFYNEKKERDAFVVRFGYYTYSPGPTFGASAAKNPMLGIMPVNERTFMVLSAITVTGLEMFVNQDLIDYCIKKYKVEYPYESGYGIEINIPTEYLDSDFMESQWFRNHSWIEDGVAYMSAGNEEFTIVFNETIFGLKNFNVEVIGQRYREELNK
jgi:hypothetical protein